MKQSLLILFLFLPLRLLAPVNVSIPVMYEEPVNPFKGLWEATCFVESSNNPLAVGDTALTGRSYGIAQIRQTRLDDYAERTGVYYSVEDMFDPERAKEVWMFYASQIGPYDMERIAKNWNGSGSMTEDYWKRVKMNL